MKNVAARIGLSRVVGLIHLANHDSIDSIAGAFVHQIFIMRLPDAQHWEYKVKDDVVLFSRRCQPRWRARLCSNYDTIELYVQ